MEYQYKLESKYHVMRLFGTTKTERMTKLNHQRNTHDNTKKAHTI